MSYYYVTEIYTHKMRIHNEYSVNVQTKAQGLLRIDTYTERIKPDNNFGFKWNILSCNFGIYRINHNVRQDSTKMFNINQSILSSDVSYPKSLIINTTEG